MLHNKDIHGKDWSNCDHCPFIEKNQCPSRRHRDFCKIALIDPEKIASMKPENRPAFDRNVKQESFGVKKEPEVNKIDNPKPNKTERQETRHTTRKINLIESKQIVMECDYRGPIVEGGSCNCKVVCFAGNGSIDKNGVSIATKTDCYLCSIGSINQGKKHVEKAAASGQTAKQ